MSEHEQFSEVDAWTRDIQTWLDGKALSGEFEFFRNPDIPLTTSYVLRGALRMQSKDINRANETRVGGILKKLGYVSRKKTINGARQNVYERP
ncbi:hypothetical protein AWV79_28205 [Cupriavidus sp. UYMMa02A]|nr:hypothetical protein AWV79_28205 [Cupriavidus sp. UYMMa02A]